jgi:drug/metabolite transporter (DMT)-like permease
VLTGILAGLAAGALWGLVFVAPRMVPGFSAVDLTAGRFISFGAVSLVAMLLTLRTRRLPNLQQALAALGMSVLGFTGYYLLLALAIRDAGTEVPALIIGTIPIWMMLLGKPLGLAWKSLLPGMLLTALGLGLMLLASGLPGDLAGGSGRNSLPHYWRGIASAVAAMVCWTAFGLLNSAWLKRHTEVNATDWANWLGCATGLGALVLWFLLGSEPKVMFSHVLIQYFAIVCIVTGIGSAWIATILWNLASQRLSASLCGQLIVSETVFALVYSYVLDGQWPRWIELAACVLFVLGILATIKAHDAKPAGSVTPRPQENLQGTS